MLNMRDAVGWRIRLVVVAALMALVAVVFCAAQQAANDTAGAACAQIPDSDIPLANTMQAKVTNPIEAAHLKPGKKLWVNAAVGMIYPGCRLESDAAIYGTVTAASASKNPAASELSIDFNSADCTGHAKQNMKLVLIGVLAPDAAASTPDAQLNPGGAPHTVKPGVVLGYKNLKLEPQGGPQCSARMTSTDKNIQLTQGAVLLLAVPGGQ
jgi:hypothetical protein